MAYEFAQRHEHNRTRMRAVNSREVVYRRGRVRVTVVATVYELHPDELIPFGVPLDVRVRDYLIDNDSVIAEVGNPFKCPTQGDVIEDGAIEATVTPLNDEPCFRYTTNRRTAFRIHTKVTCDTRE